MSEKPTILVYHHGDMDGICAAAIVAKRFRDHEIKPVSVQYGKDTWCLDDVEQASKVFVVDFSFSDMEVLANIAGDKLVWIDHHKTAMERFPELWDSDIEGIRSLELSGCELTWKYCYYLRQMPLSVHYIGDRDMWKFSYPETKAYCAGLNTVDDITNPLSKNWHHILELNGLRNSYINIGNILLKAQESRVKALFEAGEDVDFQGFKARLVNATCDISELGEYIYNNGYDIAVIWQVKKDKVQFSLRSNKVDCSEIAKLYGGGGHKGAAGFTVMFNEGFLRNLKISAL